MRFLISTPLEPLAKRARELSASCASLDVMTAFVGPEAVADVVEPAARRGARVRFLTGTYGNVTRKATFEQIATIASESSATAARIWRCREHGRLHAKMFVWRRGNGDAVVWIGSANLTDHGLQEEGEVVAEIEVVAANCASVDEAFDREWGKGAPLDSAFLDSYREAPRSSAFLQVYNKRKRTKAIRVDPTTRRMFVAEADIHHAEGSEVDKRVTALLSGTAVNYYVHKSKLLEKVAKGDLCLHIDHFDASIGVVEVTDVGRDGDEVVFAHDLLDGERGWSKLTKKTIAALRDLGLRRTKAGIGSQWVPPEMIDQVIALVNRAPRQ